MIGGIFKGISRVAGWRGAGIGAAAFGLSAYSSYKDDRARGMSEPRALAGSVAQAVLWTDFWIPMTALSVAKAAPGISQAYQNGLANLQRTIVPFGRDDGAGMSVAAQTSRARAMEAIQNSRLNARSYVGREAGIMASRYR